MKRRLLTSILCLIYISSYSQYDIDKYPNKEKDDYYKKTFKYYKEHSSNEYLDNIQPHYKINKLSNFTPYIDTLIFPENLDSLIEYLENHMNYSLGFNPIIFQVKDSIEVVLFSHGELPGVWIGYSKDYGNKWTYYYTGIRYTFPLLLKWYSKIPLILNENKIQIEAALFQRNKSESRFSRFGYIDSLFIDGLIVEFDINKLSLDSDEDGLTDIVEKVINTNIHKKDTDNDGISDFYDLNPRYNLEQKPLSEIYSQIIDEELYKIDKNELVNKYYLETILVVTNNIDLLCVNPNNVRIIFMTENEYENYTNKNNAPELNNIMISPLFKVDNMIDSYLINTSSRLGSQKYYIHKKDNKWNLELIFRANY